MKRAKGKLTKHMN